MVLEVRTTSIEPHTTEWFPEVAWRDVNEPGAYVEVGSGDLYRFPMEALLKGTSPLVRKESAGASRLVRISKDPFITTLEARMLCAEHNIKPNF